jgi:hypothetical protein
MQKGCTRENGSKAYAMGWRRIHGLMDVIMWAVGPHIIIIIIMGKVPMFMQRGRGVMGISLMGKVS